MIHNQRVSKWLYSVFRAILLIALSYIVLYPLLYMLSSAFTPKTQAADPSVIWVPKALSFENFTYAFNAMDYIRSCGVTFRVEIVSGLIEVFTCSVIAYGFARFQFPLKPLLFGLVVVTIIVPPQAIIVPLYLNYRYLDFFGILKVLGSLLGVELRPNLLNTGWTFYLPSIFGVGLRSGLFIFIYRQFFMGLPNELEEAARIDGAGALRTFGSIVIPSSGVAILCVTIFSFIWHWNDYYQSAMFLSEKFPLSVNLSMISDNIFSLKNGMSYTATTNVVMAGCVLFILPPLLLYIVLQRKFIQSIDRIGIVG